jgi:hypothetical protein
MRKVELRKETGELFVGEDGAESIPQAKTGIPLRKHCASDGRGVIRDGITRGWMQRHDDLPITACVTPQRISSTSPFGLDIRQQYPNRGNPNPELGPIIMPEVKLGKVAVQVGLADVLIDAANAALQDQEVVFRLGPSNVISPMQS